MFRLSVRENSSSSLVLLLNSDLCLPSSALDHHAPSHSCENVIALHVVCIWYGRWCTTFVNILYLFCLLEQSVVDQSDPLSRMYFCWSWVMLLIIVETVVNFTIDMRHSSDARHSSRSRTSFACSNSLLSTNQTLSFGRTSVGRGSYFR